MDGIEIDLVGFLLIMVAFITALVVWAITSSSSDMSNCDLGPPVYISTGNGVVTPTYPFMSCE